MVFGFKWSNMCPYHEKHLIYFAFMDLLVNQIILFLNTIDFDWQNKIKKCDKNLL